jgi:hypothetical protein
MNFSSMAGAETPQPVGSELFEGVHEGGEGDATRFIRFSRNWGHDLHCVRQGLVTFADAGEFFRGWVYLHMKPAWPEERITYEMKKIALLDVAKYGPFKMSAADPASAQPAELCCVKDRV